MKTKFLSVLLFLSLIMGSCINEPFHTRARFPSVSIDGKLIAFFYDYGNNRGEAPFVSGIYIMPFNGEGKKLIYPLYSMETGYLNWNPAKNQLLISEGIITLHNNEFSKIQLNKLFNSIDDVREMNFTWAPDGKSLLYNINDSMYICDTLFQQSRKLSLQGRGARWMPDGKRLTYMRNGEIYIADTLSYQETQITNDGMRKGAPIPSPDGTKLSYIVSDNNIWLINIDGSNPHFLTKSNWLNYSWTPDSKAIVYSKEDDWDTFLWKIDIDGKNDIQISKE